MKKIIASLLIGALAFATIACSTSLEKKETGKDEVLEENVKEEVNGKEEEAAEEAAEEAEDEGIDEEIEELAEAEWYKEEMLSFTLDGKEYRLLDKASAQEEIWNGNGNWEYYGHGSLSKDSFLVEFTDKGSGLTKLTLSYFCPGGAEIGSGTDPVKDILAKGDAYLFDVKVNPTSASPDYGIDFSVCGVKIGDEKASIEESLADCWFTISPSEMFTSASAYSGDGANYIEMTMWHGAGQDKVEGIELGMFGDLESLISQSNEK